MLVRELLTERKIVSLGPGDTALDAARAMTEAHVGSVVVRGEDGKLLGIFTERDLMNVVSAGQSPASRPLREVMTVDLYTTDPGRAVTDVRREMRDRHIRHVPVLLDGEVLAVLGMRDLLYADFVEKRQEVNEMTAYIRGEAFGREA